MSAKRTTTADGAHKWEFKARFRRHAFGWKSQPAIQRIKQALREIKKAARRDPLLAAPLATVVIGGLVTSTLLTLFVPALYAWTAPRRDADMQPVSASCTGRDVERARA